MADGTLDSELFFLRDGFGGGKAALDSYPPDGFTGASHHNVASPVFAVGEQRVVRVTSHLGVTKGFSVLTYLKTGTQVASIAAKSVCQQLSATIPNVVSNNASSTLGVAGPIAVALSAMTDAYYGWYWTGGLCPEVIPGCPNAQDGSAWQSAMGGNYLTDGLVVAGAICAKAGTTATTILALGPVVVASGSGVSVANVPGAANAYALGADS